MTDMDVAYWMAKYDQLKEDYADLREKYGELREDYTVAEDRIAELENLTTGLARNAAWMSTELAKYQWISVKDKLPVGKINPITQDFELVICATTFGDVRAYGYGKAKGHDKAHFWHGAGIMDEYVTHWMPLPNMPEQPYEEWDRIAKERDTE